MMERQPVEGDYLSKFNVLSFVQGRMTDVNFAAERDKKSYRSSPEVILPSPHRREHRHRRIERAPGLFLGRRAPRRLPRSQEWVDAPLQANGRGQGGQIPCPLHTRPVAMRAHIGVVR